MKKFIRAAVVLGMILCLSVTALAAADISPTGVCEIDPKNVTGPDGNPVDFEITDIDEQEIPVEYGGEVDFGDGDPVPAESLTLVFWKDIDSDTTPVTITFDVPAAGANDILHVMHYNGTKWEQVAEGKGSSVTATFTSLSPVAVVLEHPAETTPVPGGTTSPVTGEAPVLLVAAVVALLAGTVAVVAVKKRKEM